MLKVKTDMKVGGFYKIDVKKENGDVYSTGIFENLVTNYGLNQICNDGANVGGASMSYVFKNCYVGTGNTPPVNSNTSLENLTASTTNVGGGGSVTSEYRLTTRVATFAQGVIVGNISEVGFGYSSSQIASRALIKDINGNPVTLTIVATDQVSVTYYFRLYLPPDLNFTMDLDGVTYDVLLTPMTLIKWYSTDGVRMHYTSYQTNPSSFPMFSWYTQCRDSTTEIDNNFTSNNTVVSGWGRSAYIADSFTVDSYVEWNYTKGLFTNGIRLIQTGCGSNGNAGAPAMKLIFTPAIPKNNQQKLTINFSITLSRYTPP